MGEHDWRQKLPRSHGEGDTGSTCDMECRQPVRDQAHCTVCHHTFRHVGHYEMHRQAGCIQPYALHLAYSQGLWDTEEGHDNAMRAGERLKKARSGVSSNT